MQAFIGEIRLDSGKAWTNRDSLVIFFSGCNFNCPFCNRRDISCTKEEHLLDIKSSLETKQFQSATRSSTFFISTQQIIEDFKTSLKILKEYENKTDIEFRTTVVPGLMYKKEHFLEIGRQICNINARLILQRFNPENVADKRFSEIEPPSVRFLSDIKAMLNKNYPQLRIEVIE